MVLLLVDRDDVTPQHRAALGGLDFVNGHLDVLPFNLAPELFFSSGVRR
jgi:hypothetical protein